MLHLLSRLLNRSRGFCRLLPAVGLFLVSGCGGPQTSIPEPAADARLPTVLVLEREIGGKVLGRSIKAPIGIAVDRRGTLFLADTGNDRIVWFNADLVPIRDLTGEGSRSGAFDRPRAVTVDDDLNIWVSDSGKRRLCQYSERLEFIDEIDLHDENDPLSFGHPDAIALSRFGEIYVADMDRDRIAVLDNFGDIERFIGDFGYPGGHLDEPAGIGVDRHDNLLVCDAGNARVMVYDDRGGVIREIGNEILQEPGAVALDRREKVWVLDRLTAQIHCFSKSGELIASLGPTLAGVADGLSQPSALAFTADGHLAITDTGHDRLLICRIIYDDNR